MTPLVNLTIARITLRGLLGRRRSLLLIPLPLLLVGLAVLCRAGGVEVTDWGPVLLNGLGIAVVLPLTALIIGTSVIGSEIDDGTVVHILTKPLPRREIVLSKLVVAFGVTAPVVAVPMFVAGLVAGSTKLAIALAVGCVVGSLAYSAVFLALSLLTRRAVLAGLAYVLLWEGLLGNLLDGSAVLSVQQYTVTMVDRMNDTGLLTGTVSLPVAVVMSVAFIVAGTALAIERLRSFSLAGDTS